MCLQTLVNLRPSGCLGSIPLLLLLGLAAAATAGYICWRSVAARPAELRGAALPTYEPAI